jgi:hypothetical protein
MQGSLARNGAAPVGFAKGWYLVSWSTDLEPGGVKPLRYFGKNYVLFRGEDGKATLLDASRATTSSARSTRGASAPRVAAPRYHTHLAYLLAPPSVRIGFRNTAG